ncbi:MAG: hypothetical protein HC915_20555 [Anaerolineae bacterium]|nr:hypothetical protein [Anaerolineae bacterium]
MSSSEQAKQHDRPEDRIATRERRRQARQQIAALSATIRATCTRPCCGAGLAGGTKSHYPKSKCQVRSGGGPMPLPVTPHDKHRMHPLMEYCMFVFDSTSDSLRIVWYDQFTYTQEEYNDISSEGIERLRNEFLRDRWEYVSQVNHMMTMCFYYQRMKLE